MRRPRRASNIMFEYIVQSAISSRYQHIQDIHERTIHRTDVSYYKPVTITAKYSTAFAETLYFEPSYSLTTEDTRPLKVFV